MDYDYFNFYGIKLLSGRKFSRDSRFHESVILNEEAAKLFGFEKPEQAVNQKILLGGLNGQIVEAIGVIKNYHHKSLKSSIEPVIFNPIGYIKYFSLKIDGRKINQTIALIEDTWHKVFPDSPFEYFFLDESFNNQYKADQQFGKVFGLFAVFAIFVSCLGLFGLASFTSEQRTKEIGVRKVLGASVSGIIILLSKEFTKWVIIANLFAWPAAWYGMNKWLQNFAYRIDIGLLTFLLAGALALIIALLTVTYQAIRAATANPVEALRYE